MSEDDDMPESPRAPGADAADATDPGSTAPGITDTTAPETASAEIPDGLEATDHEAAEQVAGGAGEGAASAKRPQRGITRVVRARRRGVVEWVIVLVLALLLAVGIRTFVLQAFFIPSASMEPTLNIGDRILVEKALFDFHHLHEGDIVVFRQPPHDTMCGPPENDLVKRVIGLPGQRIYSTDGFIYVDGKRLTEPYLPASDPLGPAIQGTASHPFVVPANEFFVMGDNRAISCDSRYWGPITGQSIVGKVVLRWWHNGHPDVHLF